jgi:ElaB/YqjD/DUF883 family membrane-anchored ribosome-binding protein
MPTKQFDHAAHEANTARDSAIDATVHGQAALDEVIRVATKAAETAFKHRLEPLLTQARSYLGNAGEHYEEGQRQVARQVRERPITLTLAAVGVGMLLGSLLLSTRSK